MATEKSEGGWADVHTNPDTLQCPGDVLCVTSELPCNKQSTTGLTRVASMTSPAAYVHASSVSTLHTVQRTKRGTHDPGDLGAKEGEARLKENSPEAEEVARRTLHSLVLLERRRPVREADEA